MTSGVTVLLLGDVEARRRSGSVAIPGLKLQALLALLALSAPHPVSDGRLIDELWGDHLLSNSSNSLHSQIAILRRVLGREVVIRVGHGYALAVEPDDVDALRFERLVDRARQLAREGDHRSAAQGFQTAISLIRGPPLGDLIDYPFGHAAAAHLEQMLLDAHEGFADAELSSGRQAEVVVGLAELVRRHPLRERFHAQLILALYRCGRQADALRAARAARDVLIERLGVEPGSELRDLELAVLSHDPRLAVPTDDGSPSLPPPGERVVSGTPGRHARNPLVGRVAELDLLRSDLDDALAGRGRIALLAGEPGIGKTRLAEEIAEYATIRGFVVARSQCHGGRGVPAFWPWTRTVEWLVAHLPADVVTAALGREASAIGRLVPEIGDVVPDLGSGLGLPAALDPEYERFRLCDALSRFVCRLAERHPVLIVLEDLHWADAASLDLLALLAVAVVEAPMMIVASYRTVGVAGQGRLTETLAELARQPVVRRLDVRGLDEDAVGQLMAATGYHASDELVGAVHRRTQGNPFFLVETLRLRSATGEGPDLGAVPTGVREVIRQRLGLLPAETVDAMQAAAVLGEDFDLAILAATLDLDAAACLRLLEPAVAAALVVASPEDIGRLQFSHVLVRDTLYEELGVATRAHRHQRAAMALEAVHGEADGPHLMALAEHWFHAVPAAPGDRGVHYAVRAARWSQQRGAHEQVEEQLRAALMLLRAIPDARRRAELELEIQYEASVHLVMTTGYSTSGIDRVGARMSELCDVVVDRRLLVPALWRLSIFHLFGDELDRAVATGERLVGLSGPGADPSPKLAGDMVLGMVHSHRGDLVAARRHLDRADRLCRASDGPLIAGFVAETPAVWIAMFSAWNWSLLGHDDRAEREVAEAIGLATEVATSTNTYALTFATWVASLVALLRRDAGGTRRLCDEGIAIANARGYGMEFVPFMRMSAGWAEAVTGDVETGVSEIVSAAATVSASGARMWEHVVATFLADAYVTRGRFVDALSHADDGLAQLRTNGARWLEAELHRLRGEALAGLDRSDPAAAEAFGRAIAVARRQGAAGLRRRAEAGLAHAVGS